MSLREVPISYAEVSKHDSSDDCWVVVHGKVYDVSRSGFIRSHSGGITPIKPYFGCDITESFDRVHPKTQVDLLPDDCLVGIVDTNTTHLQKKPQQPEALPPNIAPSMNHDEKPDITNIINLFDFEHIAAQLMRKDHHAYYAAGGDDEITMRENHSAFKRIWLKPRVLVDVSSVDMSTKILGYDASLPLYITAAAMGKYADPIGEVAFVRAAHKAGSFYMISTYASCSLEETSAAGAPGQVLFSQLYVNKFRDKTVEYVRRIEEAGCKAIFLTVDVAAIGRRERDMRFKYTAHDEDLGPDTLSDIKLSGALMGTAQSLAVQIDAALCWKDIAWLKSLTKLPLIIKGIQRGDDAVAAYKHGAQGVVLSNHGGRQLDSCRSGIEILPEVMASLRAAGVGREFEVFVDGGIRRGSDIFKALALGAQAVGIGRPSLYALASYGEKGVEKMFDILKEEFRTCMMLMGTPTLGDITPDLINTKDLTTHFVPQPAATLHSDVYQKLDLPKGKRSSKL